MNSDEFLWIRNHLVLQSLFMAVSGGDDWSNILRPLQGFSLPFLRWIFIGYVAFMIVGILNIITGLLAYTIFAQRESQVFQVCVFA